MLDAHECAISRLKQKLGIHQSGEQGRGYGDRGMMAVVSRQRLQRMLARMLDEGEFLSPHGMRALSRQHREHPYVLQAGDGEHVVRYEPAESSTGMFGGNSNWRGPIWFPVNYLIVESLQQFHHYYGDDFLWSARPALASF